MMPKLKDHYVPITGILVTLFFLVLTFSSCKKDGDTKGVVIVNDSIGNVVEGATVTLWQDTTVNPTTGTHSNVRVSNTTDSEGRVEFTFALEAYLNITAVKLNKTAKGFIRLKEHETVTQTVHF
jgi:hypothetical protein